MIFVTGATGYTGRWVVGELLRRKISVTCLVRETSDVGHLTRDGVPYVRANIEHVDQWSPALAGARAVISVAHIRYAPFVVEACRKQAVSRVVFFSSTWRFSKVTTPAVEAVCLGEDAVLRSGLAYTLLRPTMIYGPGDDRNISRLLGFIKRKRVLPIFGSGEQPIQPVFVADVAKAAVDALHGEAAVGNAYELAGADILTYTKMVDVLSRALGRWLIKVHVPMSLGLIIAGLGNRFSPRFPVQPDQIRRMKEDRAFDISEARSALGFDPVGFEAGIRAALQGIEP